MATPACVSLSLFVLLGLKGFCLAEDNTTEVKREKVDYRLPGNVVPFHYDLKLIPYNHTFTGSVAIKLRILNATDGILVHNRNLTIEPTATFLSSNAEFSVRAPVSQLLNKEVQMVKVHFKEEIKPGNYTLFLKFLGMFSNDKDGFYRSSYHDANKNKAWITVAELEPIFARKSFPCFDEPALKATFDIAIKHYPEYTVVSNMPILKQSAVDPADGKIWTQFETTPPISTYVVSYAIFNYTKISNPDSTTSVWCRKEAASSAKFAFQVAEKAVVELERVLNTSLRMPKLDHVSVPGMRHEGQETWGLIHYRESKFLYNESLRSADDKQETALLVAHEIAHQWFGNAVTPRWWKYQWLKEGLASYFEVYIVAQMFSEWPLFDLFVPEVLHPTFYLDVRRTIPVSFDVSSPAEILSVMGYIVYDKAPSLIRMVSHYLTEEVFLKGLSYYLQKYKYAIASPDEFWESLQTAFDESSVTPKVNLKKVNTGWYTQKGFPVVHVTVDRENGAVSVSQDCFRTMYKQGKRKENDTECDNKWWIPLNFATQSQADFSSTQPTLWLDPESENPKVTTITIDPQEWIIANIQETGFYRVNYDETNWKLIIQHLKSKDYKTIHVLNRAQILDDSFNLMLSEQLDPVLFMDLTDYLRHETDYIPWLTAFNILSTVEQHEINNNVYLKQHIWELMDGLIDRVGFDDDAADGHLIKKLRIRLRESACNAGHPKCLSHAHKKLLDLLQKPEKHSLYSYLSTWTLSYGLQNANESTWYKALGLLENETRLKKRYLACVRDPAIIKIFLNYSLAEALPLVTQERIIFIFDSVMYCHSEHIDLVLDFVMDNWDTIISRVDYPASLIRFLSNFIKDGNSNGFPQLREKVVRFLKSVGVEKSEIQRIAEDINPSVPSFLEKIHEWLRRRYSPWAIQNTTVYLIS